MSSIPPNIPPYTPHPRGKARASTSEDEDERTQASQKSARTTLAAEREAANRMMRAEEQARETERAMSANVDYVRDEYSNRLEAEEARHEAAYEAAKNKGYARLNELKRSQEKEISEVRREGERDLAKTQQYYRDNLYKQKTGGDQQLRDLQVQHTQAMNHEQRMGRALNEQSQTENNQKLAYLKETEEAKYAAAVNASKSEFDQMRVSSEAAREKSRQEFEAKYQKMVSSQNETLAQINQKGNEQLEQTRLDTSHKLAAYEGRQEDPFYKLVDLKAELHDVGDSYVLTAKIPSHEQQKVNVSLKGNNQLTISGYRRNEEKVDVGPGRTRGTASHQSFSESFPLAWPVEAKKLEKYFEGDELIVKLPKRSEHSIHNVYESKPRPVKARVERPKFPENLPNTVSDVAPNDLDPALTNSSGSSKKSQKPLG
jgi:HSP20 family molecular chaperone IbpA